MVIYGVASARRHHRGPGDGAPPGRRVQQRSWRCRACRATRCRSSSRPVRRRAQPRGGRGAALGNRGRPAGCACTSTAPCRRRQIGGAASSPPCRLTPFRGAGPPVGPAAAPGSPVDSPPPPRTPGGAPRPRRGPPVAPAGTQRRLVRPQDAAAQTDGERGKQRTIRSTRGSGATPCCASSGGAPPRAAGSMTSGWPTRRPSPAPRRLVQARGGLACPLPQGAMLRPPQQPRGAELRRAQHRPNQARHPRRRRRAPVQSRGKGVAASKPGAAWASRGPRSGDGKLWCPASFSAASHTLAAKGLIGINSLIRGRTIHTDDEGGGPVPDRQRDRQIDTTDSRAETPYSNVQEVSLTRPTRAPGPGRRSQTVPI